MVGRLVEQQQFRFGDQRARECDAFLEATGQSADPDIRVEPEPGKRRLDPRIGAPAVVVLEFRLQFLHAFEHCGMVAVLVRKLMG